MILNETYFALSTNIPHKKIINKFNHLKFCEGWNKLPWNYASYW